VDSDEDDDDDESDPDGERKDNGCNSAQSDLLSRLVRSNPNAFKQYIKLEIKGDHFKDDDDGANFMNFMPDMLEMFWMSKKIGTCNHFKFTDDVISAFNKGKDIRSLEFDLYGIRSQALVALCNDPNKQANLHQLTLSGYHESYGRLDITPISKLKNLCFFSINHPRKLTDLNKLAYLPKLRQVMWALPEHRKSNTADDDIMLDFIRRRMLGNLPLVHITQHVVPKSPSPARKRSICICNRR
jgi:hypothetical protein